MACQQEWQFVPDTYDAGVLEELERIVGDSDETVTLYLRGDSRFDDGALGTGGCPR